MKCIFMRRYCYDLSINNSLLRKVTSEASFSSVVVVRNLFGPAVQYQRRTFEPVTVFQFRQFPPFLVPLKHSFCSLFLNEIFAKKIFKEILNSPTTDTYAGKLRGLYCLGLKSSNER